MEIHSPTAQNTGIPGGPRGYSVAGYLPIGFKDTITGAYPGGGDAKLFGYLCEVWQLAWYGIGYHYEGTLPDVARIDSLRGLNDSRANRLISGPYVNEELTAVVVEIISYPPNSDLIFGEPPLINAGYAGWGWESSTDHRGDFVPAPIDTSPDEGASLFGGLDIFVRIGQQSVFARTRPENINQRYSVFFPPARNCVDFWWHLKEGVRANIHAYSPVRLLGANVSNGVNFGYNPGDTGDCPIYGFPDASGSPVNGYGDTCSPEG